MLILHVVEPAEFGGLHGSDCSTRPHAWLRFVTGRAAPVWEPTRRDALPTS
jgi:hypothetical protein